MIIISFRFLVFDHYRDTYGDFQQGWLVTTTRKDVADYEWEGFLKILYSIFGWFFIHILGSEYFRRTYITVCIYEIIK